MLDEFNESILDRECMGENQSQIEITDGKVSYEEKDGSKFDQSL
jgi:hypothetical protein